MNDHEQGVLVKCGICHQYYTIGEYHICNPVMPATNPWVSCPDCGQYYDSGVGHDCPGYFKGTEPGSTGGAGWTCPNCGQWVMGGTMHFCYNQPMQTITLQMSPSMEKKMDRLIQLLEELVLDQTGDLPEEGE